MELTTTTNESTGAIRHYGNQRRISRAEYYRRYHGARRIDTIGLITRKNRKGQTILVSFCHV